MQNGVNKWSIVMLIGLSLLFTACASTQKQRDLAQSYYAKRDYALAYQELYPLAKRGDTNAQYTIGYMYYYGFGVAKDEDVARSWIRKSADNGNARAKHALQLMLEHAYLDFRSHHPTLDPYATHPPGLSQADKALPDLTWIRQQKPQDYTVVLAENKDLKKIDAIKQHKTNGTGRFAKYRTKRGNTIEYALTYGSYPTSVSAERSINRLDKSLQKTAHLSQWQNIQMVMLP